MLADDGVLIRQPSAASRSLCLDLEKDPQWTRMLLFWGCCYEIFDLLKLFHITTDRRQTSYTD